jgi:hypothetical protein
VTDDGGVEPASAAPPPRAARVGQFVAVGPSTPRKVVVSVLGVVAVLAELAIGVFYLVLIAAGPDDPALDWLLTAIKLLFAAFYVATVLVLVWAWTRWSWLVIAAPIAAWIVFRVGYVFVSGFVPNHLVIGP